MSAADLKSRTVKSLAEMARKRKIPGWHSMRKDELVRALARWAKSAAAGGRGGNGCNGSNGSRRAVARTVKPAAKAAHANGARRNGARPKARTPNVERRLQEVKARLAQSKDLAFRELPSGNGHSRDRLVIMVRDPYWLHAYWEVTRRSIERAQAAMGQYWHGARPVLRLQEVARNGTTTSARKFVRDIVIHGAVNNWYVDVQNPPKSYQVEIGYLAPGGKFFALCRSNVVTTPANGGGDAFDKNWAEVAKDFDRVYAMSGGYTEADSDSDLREVFEERLRRPMGDPMATRFGIGAAAGRQGKAFSFKVDTELIVHGVTEPDAHVTLRGEPVQLRSDGSFAVRFSLPDRRHVLPVVASSGDGVEQHTIVLAVDRNTKVMEPVIRDPGD